MARKCSTRTRIRNPRRGIHWELLESRVLLTAFVTADLAATWHFAGLESQGSLVVDDTGAITGGLFYHIDDDPSPPSGNVAITSTGLITVTSEDILTGAMNSAKDLFAVSRPNNDGHGLGLAVRPLAAAFSNADLNGSWSFSFDGDSSDSNGFGTVIFNGAGGITGGSATTGQPGSTAITGGSYTVNGDSTASIIILTGGDPLQLTGALNASKDVLVSSPPTDQFQAAASDNASLLFVMVHNTGAYTNADAAGTWDLSGADGSGFVTLDAAGHITAGQFSSSGGTSVLGGSYTLSNDGVLHLTGTGSQGSEFFQGALNAGKNAVVMNATDSGGNMLVGVKVAANHVPTFTAVAPFSTATDGVPFDITYSQLLAASNAADGDGDTLRFQVQSLGTSQGGDFMLNGDEVTNVPFPISPGDTLEWLPTPGARGAIPVFTVRAYDGLALSSTAVPVVVNTVLADPVTFDNDAINDTWDIGGPGYQGQVSFDDSGNISDGVINTDGSATFPGTGTYTLNSDGTLSLSNDPDDLTGAMSRTQDVIAVSNQDDHSLGVLVRHSEDNYGDGDLLGTWTTAFTSDDPGNNGIGTFTFDGMGDLTGNVKSANGSQALNGTYDVAQDGTVNIEFNGGFNVQGHLSAAKDVLILNPSDIAQAVSDDNPRFIMLVHGFGTFTAADFNGSWLLAADNTTGLISLDGAGHVTGTETDNGSTYNITGTYTIKSDGTFTANFIPHINGTTLPTRTFTGAMNGNRDLMIANRVAAGAGDQLGVLIATGGHVPAFSTVAPFATAIAGQPFAFTYDDLLAASNAADVDGDAIVFNVTALSSGTLKINDAAVSSFPATIEKDDTNISWTPAAGAKGNITGFSVTVTAGTASTATPVPVVFKTVLPAAVTLAVTRPKASEINGTSSGMGLFTLTRTNGILTSPLDVTIAVTGSATNGTDYTAVSTEVHFSANQSTTTIPIQPSDDGIAEGSETAIVTIVDSDTGQIYTIGAAHSGTVTIADAASTITAAVSKPKASELNGTSSGMGQFILTRTGGDTSSPHTVTFALSGADGSHYAVPTPAGITYDVLDDTGTVTFAAGKTTALVSFFPVNDSLADTPPLSVTLTVTPDGDPASYFIGAASHPTVNITDAAPTVSVTAKAALPISNGSVSRLGQFTVLRTGLDKSQPLNVVFSLSGSAVDLSNFTIANSTAVTFDAISGVGTLTLSAGQTSGVVTVNPISTLAVNATADAMIFTIITDGGPGYFIDPALASAAGDRTTVYSATVTKPKASEINGSTSGMGQFTIVRKGGDLTRPVTVTFTLGGTASGFAVPEVNYHLLTAAGITFNSTTGVGTVLFAANKTSVNIPFNSIDDGMADPPLAQGGPDVHLALSQDDAHTFLIDPANPTADIIIADAASKISVTTTKQASELNGSTSGMGTFTFIRTGGNLKVPLTINFDLGGSATEGSDYPTINPHTVTFAANKTSATINIKPVDGDGIEGPETVQLTLKTDNGTTYFLDPAFFIANMTITDHS